MKHTFLITTAAAALLAGTALASAQGAMDKQLDKQAPLAGEQKAPDAGKAQTKGSAGAEIKADKPALNAQGSDKAGAKTDTTGQASPSKDMKGQDKALDAQKQDSSKSPAAAQSKSSSDIKSSTDTKSSTEQNAQAPAKSGTTTSSSSTSSGTSANVTLNADQKTKIRETVIQSSSAPRVNNVNFSLSVGTVVPRTVHFAPLPRTIVEIQPAWRGYEYFIVGEEIIIIEPRTLKIVAVLQV